MLLLGKLLAFLLVVELLLQAVDPFSSVERIGFFATVGIIFTLLLVWGVKKFFGYLTERLDKKDEQISTQYKEHLLVIDDRKRDLERVEHLIENQTGALREVTRGLQALADEMRRKKE